MNHKVELGLQATGVPGLDILLGGGLGEYSFNVIAGAPGSGKTTLAHQIMFSLAGSGKKALFFTVLGEPPLKMLRYQQQFGFFDIDKVDDCIRYVNLAEDLRTGDFSGVLQRIASEVAAFSPGLVFVDSFRSVVQTARSGNEGVADLQHFIQELGVRMTSWQATTFLIGEYANPETEANPIMTVADGMLSLTHDAVGNSTVRKIRIVKMRGQAHLPGAHTFRIGADGLQIFPRMLPQRPGEGPAAESDQRVCMGNDTLDAMLCGGLPQGHALMVVGPSGSGKTILGTAFLAEGARRSERGVVACFEKGAARLRNAQLASLVADGAVAIVETHLLDQSVEEILDDLETTIRRTGARRVVIDSLSEVSLYLAPEFRDDFRESVFRILAGLARLGVTVVVTMGLEDHFNELRFSRADTAFLVDAIIAMRYVEIEGRLAKVISVVKVRGSAHSTDLRRYDISVSGLHIEAQPLRYDGLLSGRPSAPGTGA